MTATSVDTSVSELAESFHRDGFAVARGLFSPGEVALIRETFMEQAKDGPVDGLSEGGARTYDASDPLSFYPRMMHPHRHPDKLVGPLSERFMLDARLQTILTALMDEEPAAAQSMFYFKPAGARGQDLHQDNFYLRVAPGTCYAAWVAIDDADRENGGMVVVPGTHNAEIACPQSSDKTRFFTDHHVPVPDGLAEQGVDLKAGDVLFFNGSVIHGSYPNISENRFRRAFICHYVPRSSAEVSHFYRCVDFENAPIPFPQATGGGPCGMEAKGPH